MRRRRTGPGKKKTYPEPIGRKEAVVREARAVETRVFRSGNSDAVRLPKRWGLAGRLVRLRDLGGGRILVEPKTKRGWPNGFLNSFGQVSSDFSAGSLPPVTADEEMRDARRFRRDE